MDGNKLQARCKFVKLSLDKFLASTQRLGYDESYYGDTAGLMRVEVARGSIVETCLRAWTSKTDQANAFDSSENVCKKECS